MVKKMLSEMFGTFVFVFIGTTVSAFSEEAIEDTSLVVGLAFGLAIIAMFYSIGSVSGAHLNPAVTISMLIDKRISKFESLFYFGGQVFGGILGSFLLLLIMNDLGKDLTDMGQNTTGDMSIIGAFTIEILLTFIFVLIFMIVTSSKNSDSSISGIVIGLTLVMIHLVSLPLTGTSVNPVRSLGPAIFVGGRALSELWIFIVAPLFGGIIAALVSKFFIDNRG